MNLLYEICVCVYLCPCICVCLFMPMYAGVSIINKNKTTVLNIGSLKIGDKL